MDVKLSRFNPPINLARTDPEQLRDLLRADCLDLRGALAAPQANCLPAGNAHPAMGFDRDFRPPLRKDLQSFRSGEAQLKLPATYSYK